ncbi:flavodoxin domain-containing protein [Candidatus Bathyarchaeota archaeon]|nr:flavodoxin domain-containing protein [Candidatus Bathyarchaeota archaeon]
MKVLVVYYSETGNTEKIAKAIYEEASRKHEAHLKRVKDIKPETLNDYDLVFLGSPCHSSDLAAPVKKLLKEFPESPKFKLAGFFTHSVWSPEQNELGQAIFDRWASKCIDSFEDISQEKHIDFRGYYHCQGSPSFRIKLFIRFQIIRSQSEWKKYIEEAKKHPNQQDLKRASDFAQKIIFALT